MKTAREIENEVARWLVRNDQGGLPSSALAACESWLAADLRHRAAYVRMRTAWRRASELGPRMRPHDGRVDPDLLKPQAQRLTARRRFAIALAAGVAAVAIGLATVLLLQQDRGWEAIDTEFGALTEVVLIDGTRVHLNSDTEIRVRMTARQREVIMVRGEAHFSVAHETARPFKVVADGAVVRAVGTAFAVRMHDRRHLEMIVAEGSVSVALAGDDAKPKLLSAGEAASVRLQHIAIRRVGREEMARRLEWMQGAIRVSGLTLEAAVAEFNRYNHRRLVIAHPAIATLPAAGRFGRHAIDDFVASLDQQVRAQRVVEDGSVSEIRLYKK